MAIEIRKAERAKSKLRLGLAGPSGSGKTMSALKLARGVVGSKGRVVMIDTERGSGDLYAHLYDYDIISLRPPYKPEMYIEAIRAAEKAGYDAIIIDSLSHAWSDEGGLLDQADKLSAGSNRFTVWAKLTPQHRALVNAMLNSPAHIVATVRSKQDYAMDTDEKGKTIVKKLGLAPVQREGMEYEFTVFMDIDQSHYAKVSKDRTNMFDNEVFIIDEKTGERLSGWLNTGIDRAVLENKKTIFALLQKLESEPKNAEEASATVKTLTGLDLAAEENYPEIISRLQITLQEKIDAKKQAAAGPVNPPAPGPAKKAQNGLSGKCNDCQADITPAEGNYSLKHYGLELCRECQDLHEKIQ